VQHYLRDPTLSRFDTMPECDRQTDTRRQHIPRYSIASRGNNPRVPPHLRHVVTLPCEMSSVLKATIANKRTSVTIHFKKLITGNNVFSVSVIV